VPLLHSIPTGDLSLAPAAQKTQRMLKQFITCLMLLNASAAAFAADDVIRLAYLGRDRDAMHAVAVPPAVTETLEYYDIRGACEKDLRLQLRNNGTPWQDGKKYDSHTIWSIAWEYEYDRGSGNCSPESFRVSVDVAFRYPKWVDQGAAPMTLANKWEDYLQNLVRHENGHRDIAVQTAAQITRAVAGMHAAPTCADLDREITALSRRYMKILNEAQRQYDAVTDHGAVQGASL
jgi:predicted secreted Zn-dependent protease